MSFPVSGFAPNLSPCAPIDPLLAFAPTPASPSPSPWGAAGPQAGGRSAGASLSAADAPVAQQLLQRLTAQFGPTMAWMPMLQSLERLCHSLPPAEQEVAQRYLFPASAPQLRQMESSRHSPRAMADVLASRGEESREGRREEWREERRGGRPDGRAQGRPEGRPDGRPEAPLGASPNPSGAPVDPHGRAFASQGNAFVSRGHPFPTQGQAFLPQGQPFFPPVHAFTPMPTPLPHPQTPLQWQGGGPQGGAWQAGPAAWGPAGPVTPAPVVTVHGPLLPAPAVGWDACTGFAPYSGCNGFGTEPALAWPGSQGFGLPSPFMAHWPVGLGVGIGAGVGAGIGAGFGAGIAAGIGAGLGAGAASLLGSFGFHPHF